MHDEGASVVFEQHRIRRVYDDSNELWYFSVIDVVAALTDSGIPRDYWFSLKTRVKMEDGFELSTMCRRFKLRAPDGKMRETDCANVEGLLRIIQSIPSPKTEPFERWLAKVGYDHVQDTGYPAKYLARAREYLKQLGRSPLTGLLGSLFRVCPPSLPEFPKGYPEEEQRMQDDAATLLPSKRTTSAVEYVDQRSTRCLVFEGLWLYVRIVLIVTFLQWLLVLCKCPVVEADGTPVTAWLDLAYFNFVTILTIGYGDYAPIGVGRLLIVVEALAGVGLFGVLVGATTLKAMLPRHDSIVFSRYCYFDKEAQRFVVQFVNTTHTRLVNTDMCSVLKLGRANWIVRSAYRTPYVGESGWTFSVNGLWEYIVEREQQAARAEDRFPQKEIDDFLSALTIYADDGLKFGITGSHGFSTFSAAKKYTLKECWVVESKESMRTDDLRDPGFGSEDFDAALHYIPDSKQTFLDYAMTKGAIVETQEG